MNAVQTDYWLWDSSTCDEGEPFNERLFDAWTAMFPASLFRQEAMIADGVRVPDWPIGAVLDVARGKDAPPAVPDVPFVAGLLCISQRTKNLLEHNIKDEMEMLPVLLTGPDINAPSAQYWFLNVLNRIDCVDWHRSAFEMLPTGRRLFERMVVSRERIPSGVDLLRPLHCSCVVLASDRIRRIIRGAGLTGGGFRRWAWWS